MGAENLTLAIAPGAGLLSFASPCVVPLVPGYLGYLTGTAAGTAAGQTEASAAAPGPPAPPPSIKRAVSTNSSSRLRRKP